MTHLCVKKFDNPHKKCKKYEPFTALLVECLLTILQQ